MRLVRTLVSAISILAGALLIVGWATSSIVVRSVEEGTALTSMAATAFDLPGVLSAFSTQVQDQTLDSLSERGIEADALGVEGEVRSAVDSAVTSPAFEDAVMVQVAAVQDSFLAELTADDREPAPLVLAVDVSSLVNARIDDAGRVGDLAPDVTVAPVELQVLNAEAMENSRKGYAGAAWLAAWGLWVGLACLAVGVLVSHRRRWFVSKALLAVGVLCLVFAAVVAFVRPESVMSVLPGGLDGMLGQVWEDTVTSNEAGSVATRAALIGAACLAGSVLMAAVGRLVGSRR